MTITFETTKKITARLVVNEDSVTRIATPADLEAAGYVPKDEAMNSAERRGLEPFKGFFHSVCDELGFAAFSFQEALREIQRLTRGAKLISELATITEERDQLRVRVSNLESIRDNLRARLDPAGLPVERGGDG